MLTYRRQVRVEQVSARKAYKEHANVRPRVCGDKLGLARHELGRAQLPCARRALPQSTANTPWKSWPLISCSSSQCIYVYLEVNLYELLHTKNCQKIGQEKVLTSTNCVLFPLCSASLWRLTSTFAQALAHFVWVLKQSFTYSKFWRFVDPKRGPNITAPAHPYMRVPQEAAHCARHLISFQAFQRAKSTITLRYQ